MTNSQRIRELTYKAKVDRLQRQIDDIMFTLKDGTMHAVVVDTIKSMKLYDRIRVAWSIIRGK